MFSGDDVDKPVKVLSGGERARVALARLLVAPGNLLLMDEPTNHLDLESSESLCEALKEYDGTLVFVSHNRSLVRNLASKIWNVENQAVDVYPGSLDEYLYSMAQRRMEVAATGAAAVGSLRAAAAPAKTMSREDDKARKRKEAEARQKRSARLGPLEKKVAQLEERIAELEPAQAKRSVDLANPDVYADEARRNKLLSEYQQAAEKLEELIARWEASQAELETAKAALDAELGPAG
jgi:ATP-binding cassette subfamily F protein 3